MTAVKSISFPFMLAGLSLLGACGGPKPAAGGNVTMRDMEVVDGTANDAMVDLDNATADGTLLSNAGALPPVGAIANAAASPAASNSAAPADKPAGNSSAAE